MMPATFARLATWLMLLLCLACAGARAETPIALFKSYAGNLNFVGTQKTMRTASNTVNPCSVATAGTTLTAALSGIPATATVVSAHLYWAGSNTVSDYTVTFEGAAVTAPSVRQFSSNTDGSSVYFSGAAEVTAQVVAKRNGNYTFSGLTINSSSAYCDTQEVLGGFALLVIYSEPAQTYRVLNLYEGFQYIRTFGTENSQVSLSLSNFQIPNPLGGATGRIGHITWEGDTSLAGTGEELRFNGTEIVDANNPTGNQFNSYSNINGDGASYGIDFDAYTLSSPIIQSGQTSATTSYKSGQDLVLLSAEIIAVPNVPVADLQLAMVRGGVADRGAAITFTSTATNLGPTTDTGPIVLTTTLGAGISYVSGAGTGWTCSAAGQVVTCSNPASLAMGASLPAVVLNATIDADAPATITTIGELSGALYDNVPVNNVVEDKIVLASDMQITMTLQDSPLTLGQQNAFLVTVRNNGPAAETGPVEVTSILPSTLRYLFHGGTDWTCSAAGQLLTCTYSGALASGASAPLLTVNFTVQSYAATVNATMTVDGTGSDAFPGNDSATLSMSMTVPKWVFTDRACTHNVSFTNAAQCKILTWGSQIGGTTIKAWLTNLNTSGVPTRLNNNNSSTTSALSMSFALSCHNPVESGGTVAGFAGLTLKACKMNGATPVFGTTTDWVSGNINFPGGSPSSSAGHDFTYIDVGRIELFMKETNTTANNGASGPFIFYPNQITGAAPGNPYTLAASHNSPAFVRAGAPFTLQVSAWTRDNLFVAKNFGKEIAPEAITLSVEAASGFAEMVEMPVLTGALGTFNAGTASGSFTWAEVGILDITPRLSDSDYIGSGNVNGQALTVGRFVPNHFKTEVPVVIACTATLNTLFPCGGRGMAYSGQPIAATVSARSVADVVLRNHQGRFAKDVTLSAATASGGALTAASVGSIANATVAATAFDDGVAVAAPAFNLAAPYINNGNNTGWSTPVDVFFRATSTENPVAMNVESLRGAIPSAATVEGGAKIVAGRLYVPHSYGSELLQRQIVVRAQYWTGSGWENSINDAATPNAFTWASVSCDAALQVLGSCAALGPGTGVPAGGNLIAGAATYRFPASGAGKTGTANVRMNGPAWLPSSTGRWRYGIYKPTPVIYIREVF